MAAKMVMCDTREEWLEARKGTIGGSEAAAVLGKSPWLTNTQLWEDKTGRKPRGEISNDATEYGRAAEDPLHAPSFEKGTAEVRVPDHHRPGVVQFGRKAPDGDGAPSHQEQVGFDEAPPQQHQHHDSADTAVDDAEEIPEEFISLFPLHRSCVSFSGWGSGQVCLRPGSR